MSWNPNDLYINIAAEYYGSSNIYRWKQIDMVSSIKLNLILVLKELKTWDFRSHLGIKADLLHLIEMICQIFDILRLLSICLKNLESR